jgi:signal transduction histidine kinase
MRISNLIFLGFFVILILFSATTYMNFIEAERVTENSDFFSKSAGIVRNSNRFQRNVLSMISGLRGYLFTGENYFIQSYDSAREENTSILEELSTVIPDTSRQWSALREIERLNNSWRDNFAMPLIEAKKMSRESNSNRLAFDRLYREKIANGTETRISRSLQQKFRDFSNYEYRLRDIRREELEASIWRTRRISFYLTSLSIILSLAIATFIAYRISNRILKMVRMADKIAAGRYDNLMIDEGGDELSKLARSLNHMAQVLSENISLLQRKNEELGQFAHIVSHDLKAPLRGIGNVVTWIEEDHAQELNAKLQEYVQHIKGRLVRAENLIEGILQYARVGRDSPVREMVDLNALVNDVVETVAPQTEIKIDVQARLPVIECEKLPLHQVLSNLIGNAVKYHDKPDGMISVSFENKDDHYSFSIWDNGPGIDRIYHEKIFGIFQTLRARDSFESTGVGLAIVKKILDDRKQTIKVASAPGQGAAFTFTWPK